MDLSMAVMILASGLIHMYAGVLLFSGRDRRNPWQSKDNVIANTPDKNIFASGILCLLAGSFWMMPLYYLAKLPTFMGMVAFISFALFVLSCTVFHVAAGFALYAYKKDQTGDNPTQNIIKIYALVYIFWAAVYSLAMMSLGLSGVLDMNAFHYLSLPLPAILIIQLGLGMKLRKTAYFTDISGTLAVMVSLLSTVNIMVSNQIQ